MYRLANAQYWEERIVFGETPLDVGADVLIGPAELMFTMVVVGTTHPRLVRQIPVVLDTMLVGPSSNISTSGIHELDKAGYWRVFGMTMMSDRRVLLTTPNNLDFWIYSAGQAENHADPATVFADGRATTVDGGFTLDDGTAWAYVVELGMPVPNGQHVIVYNLTLHDDRRQDNMSAPHCWYEGLGYSLGPWVSRVR